MPNKHHQSTRGVVPVKSALPLSARLELYHHRLRQSARANIFMLRDAGRERLGYQEASHRVIRWRHRRQTTSASHPSSRRLLIASIAADLNAEHESLFRLRAICRLTIYSRRRSHHDGHHHRQQRACQHSHPANF